VAQTLSGHPAVRYVAAATGAFHLYIEVMAATNMQLSEFLLDDLGSIPGILDTETSLILRIYKDAPASDASLEALAAGEEPATRTSP
jgi:DNA-binding Lrp family transcriptional regulator